MKPLCIFCLAAALAGWISAGWISGGTQGRQQDSTRRARMVPAQEAIYGLRIAAPGSETLAELAESIAGLPQSQLAEAVARIKGWPPGTARTLATALIETRLRGTAVPAADEEADAETNDVKTPPVNRFQKLADSMTRGSISRDGWSTLTEWLESDPATAMAAILKMPPKASRADAVDSAAEMLAETDPSAALSFFLQSGEQRADTGTALAFVNLAKQRRVEIAGFLTKFSPRQQAGLAGVLTEMAKRDPRNGGSPAVYDSTLPLLASLAMEFAPSSARIELLAAIARRNSGAAMAGMNSLSPGIPEHVPVLAAILEQRVCAEPEAASRLLANGMDGVPSPAILARVVPHVIPKLIRTGHLADAVQAVSRIQGSETWRASFEAILPAWMDADPAAARGAFDAAPLTALERERWLRHPAFLLHPKTQSHRD